MQLKRVLGISSLGLALSFTFVGCKTDSFEEERLSISMETDGDGTVNDDYAISAGTKKKIEAEADDGYEFIEWQVEPEGACEFDDDEDESTKVECKEDAIITAVFEEKEISGGDDSSSSEEEMSSDEGSSDTKSSEEESSSAESSSGEEMSSDEEPASSENMSSEEESSSSETRTSSDDLPQSSSEEEPDSSSSDDFRTSSDDLLNSSSSFLSSASDRVFWNPLKNPVPPEGKTAMVIGQELKPVEDYLTKFPIPHGVMSYTNTLDAHGLDHYWDLLENMESHVGYYNETPEWDTTFVQLAVSFHLHYEGNDHGDEVAKIWQGHQDSAVIALGEFIKKTSKRIYLRLGFECDIGLNAYPPEDYVKAYRYIHDMYEEMEVDNVTYVWHTATVPDQAYQGRHYTEWYPGDDYVDWVGISLFNQPWGGVVPGWGDLNDAQEVLDFADSLGVPAGIFEAAPYGGVVGNGNGEFWNGWMTPMLNLIEEYDIKMLSYINANWDIQEMWLGQGWGDTRITTSPYVDNWNEVLESDRYNFSIRY